MKESVRPATAATLVPPIGGAIQPLANLVTVPSTTKTQVVEKTDDKKDNNKYDAQGTDFHSKLKWVKLNNKYGYVNKSGEEVIPLKYDGVANFSEGLAGVKLNGKWGYVNQSGVEVIPLIYDDADNFKEGKAQVKLNGRYFYIDKNGNEIK